MTEALLPFLDAIGVGALLLYLLKRMTDRIDALIGRVTDLEKESAVVTAYVESRRLSDKRMWECLNEIKERTIRIEEQGRYAAKRPVAGSK